MHHKVLCTHRFYLKNFVFPILAQIDNNYMEAMLKLIVRNRKNAGFFKSASGAAITDVLTSIIATCMQNGINPFDYLNAIQRNQQAVKENPLSWLPLDFSDIVSIN